MPLASDIVEENQGLARVLCYGASMTRKTWWMMKAAEFGYNVLYLNGDRNIQVLKNISKEGQKRIRIINCFDKVDKPQYANILARLARGDEVIWNDDENRRLDRIDPRYNCFAIKLSKLTANDFLVIDSWTAGAWSSTADIAMEKDIDLSEGAKIEWDMFGNEGRFLTWLIQQYKSVPCHLGVVGHSDQYDKVKKGTEKAKGGPTIEFSRTQIVSSSRPHAMLMPKHFSDVLYFNMIGTNYYIDTSARSDRDGGCRCIPGKNWPWDELSFERFIKESHYTQADGTYEMPGCVYYPKGQVAESSASNVIADAETKTLQTAASIGLKAFNAPMLDAVKASQAKPIGLAGLLKK